jgi:hypothetical protein
MCAMYFGWRGLVTSTTDVAVVLHLAASEVFGIVAGVVPDVGELYRFPCF